MLMAPSSGADLESVPMGDPNFRLGKLLQPKEGDISDINRVPEGRVIHNTIALDLLPAYSINIGS